MILKSVPYRCFVSSSLKLLPSLLIYPEAAAISSWEACSRSLIRAATSILSKSLISSIRKLYAISFSTSFKRVIFSQMVLNQCCASILNPPISLASRMIFRILLTSSIEGSLNVFWWNVFISSLAYCKKLFMYEFCSAMRLLNFARIPLANESRDKVLAPTARSIPALSFENKKLE